MTEPMSPASSDHPSSAEQAARFSASAADQTLGAEGSESSAPTETALSRNDHDDAAPDAGARSVYLRAARTLLPCWLGVIGPTPWFVFGPARRDRGPLHALYRRQSATLGLGLLAEHDRNRPDAAFLKECVRAALIRWQLSLNTDGRPRVGRGRAGGLHAAVAANLMLLLGETSDYQTESLLSDLDRHLRWLQPRHERFCWLEAAAVLALSEAGTLLRDRSWLTAGRHRLRHLLRRQNEEGWFPELGGVDFGRLSLTIDALARVYRHTGWDDLRDPLERAVRFLRTFVQPDGSVGGAVSARGTGFISPFGPELLADQFSDAAALAAICRRRAERYMETGAEPMSAELGTTLGIGMMLAAASVSQAATACAEPVDARETFTAFDAAGLSIHRTRAYTAVVAARSGGALQVSWHDPPRVWEDAGLTVVFPHSLRVSGRHDPGTEVQLAAGEVTARGILRPPQRRTEAGLPQRRRIGVFRALWRMLRRGMRRRSPGRGSESVAKEQGGTSKKGHPGLHHRYRREITFTEDGFHILDRVDCLLPCEVIVCQSPQPGDEDRLVDRPRPLFNPPPIHIEGGRHVTIIRQYRHGELVESDEPKRNVLSPSD